MSEQIELKIDARWKWAAKDKGESLYAFTEKPVFNGRYWWLADGEDGFTQINCFTVDLGAPADSLHQIISGKLVKYVDVPGDGERVIVGRNNIKRYSAGRLNDYGQLVCYQYGADKWSCGGLVRSWEEWRRPTPEELE